jgi:hypothetical protein
VTIERSKGKARPALPRSSDLQQVTAPEPNADRLALGRAAPNNKIAAGRGWKKAIKKLVGSAAGKAELDQLVRDALCIFHADLRELPNNGPLVRPLVAARACSIVVGGHFANLAAKAGLHTTRGLLFDDRAVHHGQRVERLTVTMLDVSTKLAKTRPPPSGEPWFLQAEGDDASDDNEENANAD